MRIGLQLPAFNWGGPDVIRGRLAEIAQTAEAAGFSSIWVMDHLFQIPGVGPKTDPMLEAYSALSFLAGVTSRVKLGALVTAVVYRHPSVLVKEVTTLDVLSGGRAYLGIGAGWNEDEARGLGIPFPPVAQRFEMLEEALQIARQMFRGDRSAYEGTHYHLAEPINAPPPLSRPHPPIMVGGGGEKKTLRLVAEYGDACNLFTRLGSDVIRHKLDVLRAHCEARGRDMREIEITTLSTAHLAPGGQSVKDVREHVNELGKLGVDMAIFNMPNVQDLKPLETFGSEIIPAAAVLPRPSSATGAAPHGVRAHPLRRARAAD